MLIAFGEAGPTNQQTTDPYTFLLKTDLPQQVDEVRRALEDARIPHRTGLLAGFTPTVVFSVPDWQLDDARLAASAVFDFEAARTDQKFPWRPVQAVLSLIALHPALVFWMIVSGASGRQLIVHGALLKGAMLDEPWRLVTSLVVHIGPLHVFWNGASMMAFAVPLLTDLRYVRQYADRNELRKNEIKRLRQIDHYSSIDFLEGAWFEEICGYLAVDAAAARRGLGAYLESAA